jgi:hypothetical protein
MIVTMVTTIPRVSRRQEEEAGQGGDDVGDDREGDRVRDPAQLEALVAGRAAEANDHRYTREREDSQPAQTQSVPQRALTDGRHARDASGVRNVHRSLAGDEAGVEHGGH